MIATGCTVGGFIIDRIFHPGRRVAHRLDEFLEDWNGEPERRSPDGQVVLATRRPGIPERVTGIESRVGNIEKLLNGGGINGRLAELSGALTSHIDSADERERRITDEQADLRTDMLDAVTSLADGQRQLADRIGGVEQILAGRLRELEEAERTHRAALHELGMPTAD